MINSFLFFSLVYYGCFQAEYEVYQITNSETEVVQDVDMLFWKNLDDKLEIMNLNEVYQKRFPEGTKVKITYEKSIPKYYGIYYYNGGHIRKNIEFPKEEKTDE